MILNHPNRINARLPLVPSGDALRRERSLSGNSTSAYSIKGNAYRFLKPRFLTKVRGNFGTAGQSVHILVCSIRGDTGAGTIIEVVSDANNFSTVLGYQEITLITPIFMEELTRYVIAFRRHDGAGVLMQFANGHTPIDTGELVTSLMVRSNATPVPGVNLINPTGDLWSLDITTEAALPAVLNNIPASSPTKLLCHFDGPENSRYFRDRTGKTMTAVGNAQQRMDQSKFGRASGRFDGTGDRVTVADSADWDLGAGPYTIEMWVCLNSKITNQAFLSHWAASVADSQFLFELDGSTLRMRLAYSGSTVDIGATWFPTLAVWYHLCVERDGSGVTRVYIDGAVHASDTTQSAAPNSCSEPLVLGAVGNAAASPTLDFNGWIDELRFTKGVARYAASLGFTPPAAPFFDM